MKIDEGGLNAVSAYVRIATESLREVSLPVPT